jgi:hypothetical protein
LFTAYQMRRIRTKTAAVSNTMLTGLTTEGRV